MQRNFVGKSVAVCVTLMLVFACLGVAAQDGSRIRLRIVNMKFFAVLTPQFSDTSNGEASVQNQWLQIYMEYETTGARNGWIDELTIEWTVLMRSGRTRPMIFREKVTYIDVEDGRHHAVMYIRPGFIRRYTGKRNPDRSAFSARADILVNGNRVAWQDYSRSRPPRNWWRAQEPDVRTVRNELLPRSETPFAHMDYDFYEHIKKTKRQ